MLTNIRLISVQEYHQMAEMGIFHPEEHLELIAEQIFRMLASRGCDNFTFSFW